MLHNFIHIQGAKEHNLKNIDIDIPRDQLVVITGLSGSGKSSLAFDTIYAEGQRRYVESLSTYARQFLGQMDKPHVDRIEGLSPAIAIEQRSASKNPRSTVGTVTEIYDYLRLLFARVGHPYCYKCHRKIESQSTEQIVDQLMNLENKPKIQILAPIVRHKKGEFKDVLKKALSDGFLRARIDGEFRELSTEIELDRYKNHTIELVIDRIVITEESRSRLAESVESALRFAQGVVTIHVENREDIIFSQKFSCPICAVSYEEISPRMFSFSSPYGACPECHGIGSKNEFDVDLIIPDKKKSIKGGAIASMGIPQSNGFMFQIFASLAGTYGFSLDTPISNLTDEQRTILLYGTDEDVVTQYTSVRFSGKITRKFEGVIPNLQRRYVQTNSPYIRSELEKFMYTVDCPLCGGSRLKKESLAIKIKDKSIVDVTRLSIKSAYEFFDTLTLSEREETIAEQILKEIKSRLVFLLDVGLNYLTLDRASSTLAGGEAQRIRLATQIGSGLMGVLYILDEPSIGLHARDNMRLIESLKKLRDLGNTIIVVEHDEETMLHADYIIDLGPGAGESGGYVVAKGTPKEIKDNKDSITGRYLSRVYKIAVPKKRRSTNEKYIEIKGAKEHNLKNIDVKIPLGVFTCITGVSGSGKSTLINDILYKALQVEIYGTKVKPGAHDTIYGLSYVDKVIDIDQSPIGRTPRSNPATYTGVFTPIRELFSKTKEAKMRGYAPGRFSFNVRSGRCTACEGDGLIKIEMHFLPDVYVTCDLCKGKRYDRETLSVHYKGKNVADVLDMTVESALSFFENIPSIKSKLKTLCDVGLGYIKLGQPATTLSGGEAQRIKLSSELSKRSTGKTIYILDEPTTGLHFADVERFLEVIQRLTDRGNTVIVIEHNLDVIKTADYIIDLGPEGGDLGGTIVSEGTPEEIVRSKSYTGAALRKMLNV